MKTKLLLSTFLLSIGACLSAQIINVPANQPTIQAGIDAARNEDTVLVDTGTYYENINFKGKAITVASLYLINPDSNYIRKTIIDGSQPPHPDTASVVMFLSGEDTTSVLCGFTITNGKGIANLAYSSRCGGGIAGKESGAKIINNIVKDNEVEGGEYAGGGGIAFVFGTSSQWTVINDNIIKSNEVSASESAYGGGIYLMMNSSIERNIIENNSSTSMSGSAEGGGMEFQDFYSLGLQLRLIDNNLLNNSLEGMYAMGGGGAYLSGIIKSQFSQVSPNNNLAQLSEISGNTISNNTITADMYRYGAGIYIWKPVTDFSISFNEFSYNSGSDNQYTYGGGLFMAYSDGYKVIINSNLIMENVSEEGGGFYIMNAHNLYLTNNLFLSNNVSKWGGALRLFQYNGKEVYSDKINRANIINNYSKEFSERDNQPFISNNTFVDNVADEGGAIYVKTEPYNPLICNSIFWGNYATPDKGKDLFITTSSLVAAYNNDLDTTSIQGNWTGTNNIFEEPIFVNSGDHPYQINDYSPCIDAGTPDTTGLNLPEYDLAGEVRIFNDRVDMGSYEWNTFVGIEETSLPLQDNIQVEYYPNPFTTSTKIEYELDQSETVRITFYNQFGKEVEVIGERQHKGLNKIIWTPGNLPNGIYYFRLHAGAQVATGKMVLIR